MPAKASSASTRTCLVWVPYLPPSPNKLSGNLKATLRAKREAKEAFGNAVSIQEQIRSLGAFSCCASHIANSMTTTSPPASSTCATPSPTASFQDCLRAEQTHFSDGNTANVRPEAKKV